jgi:hypothetical protein
MYSVECNAAILDAQTHSPYKRTNAGAESTGESVTTPEIDVHATKASGASCRQWKNPDGIQVSTFASCAVQLDFKSEPVAASALSGID